MILLNPRESADLVPSGKETLPYCSSHYINNKFEINAVLLSFFILLDPRNNPILITLQSFTLSTAYPYQKDELAFFLNLQRLFGFQWSGSNSLCD